MQQNNFLSGHSDRIIKVCGNCKPENIGKVAVLAPMLMGFIFYDGSPRSALGLEPDTVKNLPDYVRPVGVFVNETIDVVASTCLRYGIKIVQLHGDESPDYCRELVERGFVVLKAVRLRRKDELLELEDYEKAGVTMFVFDTPTPDYGGSGKKFDWEILRDYPLETPYLLSGGIGENDADAIIANMGRRMAGIDVNSRFESSPGEKDIVKLTHFILSLRQFNEHEPTGTPFWEKEK